MPLFAPEEKVMEVVRMEKKPSEAYKGFQIEMEMADPNPDTGNQRNWLSIPENGRVTPRTVLGWWLATTGEVEKRVDGLDFRTAPATKKSLANLCSWMLGKWYLWERHDPPSYGYTQKPNERWVPTRKFKDEEAAVAYYNEMAVGDLSDEGDDDIPLGVPQSTIDAAMPIFISGGEKGEEFVRALAPTMYMDVDIDELIAALKEQAPATK